MSTSATAITLTLGAVLGAGWVKTFSDGAASMNVLSAAGENIDETLTRIGARKTPLFDNLADSEEKLERARRELERYQAKLNDKTPTESQTREAARLTAADHKNRQNKNPHKETEHAEHGFEIQEREAVTPAGRRSRRLLIRRPFKTGNEHHANVFAAFDRLHAESRAASHHLPSPGMIGAGGNQLHAEIRARFDELHAIIRTGGDKLNRPVKLLRDFAAAFTATVPVRRKREHRNRKKRKSNFFISELKVENPS